jgi:hypothetical protein
MSVFIPNGGPADDQLVPNDGWWPSLSTAECQQTTGIGSDWTPLRIATEIAAAGVEVNSTHAVWRASQQAASLAAVPAPQYAGVSEKVLLYRRAVYCLVRARQIDTLRDYDSTGKGHGRADALAPSADAWRQMSAEAQARMVDRPRTIVELI